jgi:uncharacterized cupredoxin-like copper-binding protein
MRRGALAGVLVGAGTMAAVSVGVAGPAQARQASQTISVIEREWKIVPSPSRASSGAVVFRIKNTGHAAHDLVVLRTNLRPKQLLPKGRFRPLEPGRVGRSRLVLPGKTVSLRLTLKPGHYLLICSLVGHLRLGMHTDFTVR